MELSNNGRVKAQGSVNEQHQSTSGSHFPESDFFDTHNSGNLKHYATRSQKTNFVQHNYTFPYIGQILDESPVFYNLSSSEKHEVLIAVLQAMLELDDASLIKAWQQSTASSRLFFKLLEEWLIHFEVNADELQPEVCYLQITAVDPEMEEEDLGSRRKDIIAFYREHSCPSFRQVENAIGMIETRTAALRNDIEEHRSSESDQLPHSRDFRRYFKVPLQFKWRLHSSPANRNQAAVSGTVTVDRGATGVHGRL